MTNVIANKYSAILFLILVLWVQLWPNSGQNVCSKYIKLANAKSTTFLFPRTYIPWYYNLIVGPMTTISVRNILSIQN